MTKPTYEELEALCREAGEALEELRDLMEGVREGEYTPDSFTGRPANAIPTKLRAAGILKGGE